MSDHKLHVEHEFIELIYKSMILFKIIRPYMPELEGECFRRQVQIKTSQNSVQVKTRRCHLVTCCVTATLLVRYGVRKKDQGLFYYASKTSQLY